MHAHYLQHVPFEGLGSIEAWLHNSGFSMSCTRFYEKSSLPKISNIDLLIILGGPMSANDDDKYPWLRLEKKFIRDCLDKGIAILGICLGAQLIAAACGAAIYPHLRKEIGWFPIYLVDQPTGNIFVFPETLDVFHWHGETFDLPANAHLLASSEACAHQAFQLGSNVLGLQFHLETTPDTAKDMVENCKDEIVEAKYIQRAERILDQSPENYIKINRIMDHILSFLTGEGL